MDLLSFLRLTCPILDCFACCLHFDKQETPEHSVVAQAFNP